MITTNGIAQAQAVLKAYGFSRAELDDLKLVYAEISTNAPQVKDEDLATATTQIIDENPTFFKLADLRAKAINAAKTRIRNKKRNIPNYQPDENLTLDEDDLKQWRSAYRSQCLIGTNPVEAKKLADEIFKPLNPNNQLPTNTIKHLIATAKNNLKNTKEKTR